MFIKVTKADKKREFFKNMMQKHFHDVADFNMPRQMARKIVRASIRRAMSAKVLGKSHVTSEIIREYNSQWEHPWSTPIASRRERRAVAKALGVPFVPVLN